MFKKGSRKAQLLLTAAKLTAPGHVEELSRQLWMRVWSRVGECVCVHVCARCAYTTSPSYQDEDITTDESFREACIKAGLSQEQADELIGKIPEEETEGELKKTTQEALDFGVRKML